MAVSEQTPYIEYIGNGITKSFALGFDCENQDHLIITIDDIEPLVGDWSLVNGSIIFNIAPIDGALITIQRNTPFSRTTDYQSYNNSFRPQSVNKDFDWIWLKLQELGLSDWLLSKRIGKEISDRILVDNQLKEYIDNQDNIFQADYILRDVSLKKYIDQMIALVTGDSSFEGITTDFVFDALTGKTQEKINVERVEVVNYYSDLSDLDTFDGKVVFVNSFSENSAEMGASLYQYKKGSWKKRSDFLTVFDFGASATTNVDSTDSLTIAPPKTELPDGFTVSADNSNFDTSKFKGNGNLRFSNHNRIMKAEYRKGANKNGIITLEDEFGQHVDANNRYSGFGCSSIANGKEYIAVRCGQNHYYNTSVSSHLVMYIIDRNKNNTVTKQVLLTSPQGHDIRDINISIMPQYANRLLIKFAMQTSSNTFETYLLVYNCTNNTVENTRKITLPTNQFTWGNSIITPTGYLLVPSYGLDGSCRIYRSTTIFDYSLSTDIAVTQAAQFESGGSAEPTICYYDDQLICFWRMGAGVNGKYNKTYNLEGTSGWGANLNMAREIHAPYVDPYNFGKKELLMMCSLGNARSLLATFATQNLESWYTTAQLYIAGDTTLANGQSGGYPSFVDYGENLSVQSYADFRSSNMALMSRLDVRMTKKQMFSALNSYEAQRITYKDSSLDWGEYSLETSAATIDIAIGLKRSLSVTKVRIRMTGVSTNTFVEILNSSGSVIATSAISNINTTGYQDVEFVFSPTALTAGNYTVRIQRRDTANPLVFNWNNGSIVKKRVIKNRILDILGLISASNSTLWNNAGIHIDLS
ncbi:hypothetical protein DJ533_11965 [Acinetobacter defluvii]|uniref:Uncharacterized protein n=1 Tax=Acinetobacter defluvii TaxID=1871111 RepID=A0A2S2FE29_9GAMM|nr:hypothetical protein [Acinetobacter defluvii]AWL29231.1 hypothetical protein DJ533_11965 [Acinetobacter defluvii]